MKADKLLDTCGLVCPFPIIKTSEMIKNLKTGEVLEVAATDFAITIDMPAWCHSTGNEYMGYEQEKNIIRAYIKKIKD